MMRMKKVLVAADDTHTSAWLRSALGDLGVTMLETRLKDVSTRLASEEFDLVVVDGGRTPEVLSHNIEHATAKGIETRLLVILEKDALHDLRLPVRLRADFSVRGATSDEVAARARNLLWPGEEVSSSELIRIDDLTVNLATYQAYWRSVPIDFTYMEYALFSFLVTHPNRAYNREVLLRRVWGSDYYGGSRTVDVHIRRIRAKLPAELSRRLDTVRNVGYLWRG